jgi:hypothetical protein
MMLERRAGTSWMPSMRACGGYGRAISMVLEVAIPIAKEEGVSPATICLAWLLAKPVVTSVIIGAKQMDQLRENLTTVEFVLSVDKQLDWMSGQELPLSLPRQRFCHRKAQWGSVSNYFLQFESRNSCTRSSIRSFGRRDIHASTSAGAEEANESR